MKNILVVSHCILNVASKLCFEDESALEEELKDRNTFLNLIIEKDIQLLQMPCPEFMMYGSQRWGHVKQQFDNPFFRKKSSDLLKPILMQIQEYHSHPGRFNILGIVSVEGSPSCGYKLTCEGDWGGEFGDDMKNVEKRLNTLKMTNNSGVFIEVIIEELEKYQLQVPIITMPEANAMLKSLEI